MQNVKNKLVKYLNNELTIKELNDYFCEKVPFSENNTIETIRLEADLTVEGELTENDIKEELISEATFKNNLKKYLKEL